MRVLWDQESLYPSEARNIETGKGVGVGGVGEAVDHYAEDILTSVCT